MKQLFQINVEGLYIKPSLIKLLLDEYIQRENFPNKAVMIVECVACDALDENIYELSEKEAMG